MMTQTHTITIKGEEHALAIQGDPPAEVLAMLPDLSDPDDWTDAASIADNGLDTCYQWLLGDEWALYVASNQGSIDSAMLTRERDLARHLLDWEWRDADPYEAIAEMGVDAVHLMTEAAEDYEGPCRVWHEPHYYHGTLPMPTGKFARLDPDEDPQRDWGGTIIEFGTRAEAQEYVDRYYDEPSAYDGIRQCNVLSHGQAGADTLTIVEC